MKAWHWRGRSDFYASGNLTIFYSQKHLTNKDFRGPDFFVVKGCNNHPCKSWVVWDENGKYPNVIIELLSASTASVDRTTKKDIYQNTFKTPEYFWFHPHTLEFKGFRLVDNMYKPLSVNTEGWLWSQELELFLGIYESKLRFFSPDKQLIPTDKERAEASQQRAEVECLQKEAAQQQAEAERQHKEAAQQQAEAERQHKEAAQQQAEAERQQKEAAQQQAEEFKRMLKALGVDPDALQND
ncbi:MAG: Uma2 family endonuclease [Scytonematopsis contorta HA4267-MV1]|nr:Uma2 family endonuclease [Scytonematopsis contorta HA4267-MV1]